MAKSRTFVLTCGDAYPALEVEVVPGGTFLNLWPKGYGNCVSLDYYDGKLRVLVNADPADEEPTDIIDLVPDPEADDYATDDEDE